jgi:hypothetical protein
MDRMYNAELPGISEYSTTENPTQGILQNDSVDIDTYDDQKKCSNINDYSLIGTRYRSCCNRLEDKLSRCELDAVVEEMAKSEDCFMLHNACMHKLYMTYALQRYRFGSMTYQMKSRFLNEIDTSKLKYTKHSAVKHARNKTVQVEGSSIRYEYYDDEKENDVLKKCLWR